MFSNFIFYLLVFVINLCECFIDRLIKELFNLVCFNNIKQSEITQVQLIIQFINFLLQNFKSSASIQSRNCRMNRNGLDQQKQQQPNNISPSHDPDVSQIDSFTQLTKSKLIKLHHRQQEVQEAENGNSIRPQSRLKSQQESSQNLVNPIHLQTRNVFVHSASSKNVQHKIDEINSSLQGLNRNSSENVQIERKLTFMRPKTTVQIQKKYEIRSEQTGKHKLPLTILEYIMQKAKIKNSENPNIAKLTQAGKKLSKLGFSKKLSEKYNTKKCNICQTQHPQKQFQKVTKQCNHEFCSSCLHQYVIYKIQAFEAVQCPNEECTFSLDQQSKLYKELPLEVRKKYKKLLQYEMVKVYPNRKMCPSQKCEGWIELNDSIDTVCNICKKQYCPKCLLTFHQGDCDNKQLQFFQGTLHYRQCNKCKNIIEKSSGCIHMTCRCGYQFCYLCGAKWKHTHTCQNPQREPIPQEMVECCCCEVPACTCDDDWMEECCGECCEVFWGWFGDNLCCCCEENDGGCCCVDIIQDTPVLRGCLEIAVKGIFIISFFGLILPLFLTYFLFMGVLWLIITIVSGMTMYTVEYISELEDCWFYLAILFFPITSFIGIVKAFQQAFYQTYVLHIMDLNQDLLQTFNDIVFDD